MPARSEADRLVLSGAWNAPVLLGQQDIHRRLPGLGGALGGDG